MGIVKHYHSSQNSKFAMSLQYLKKEVRDEVVFNTLGMKVSYKVILSLLMGMIKHSQNTQSNKFLTSLQYLKKEARVEFILCMQVTNQSIRKLVLLFLK